MSEPESTSQHRRWDDLMDQRYLTRREAEALIANDEDRAEAHKLVHQAEAEALAKALQVADRDHSTHTGFHDREHLSHQQKHADGEKAVETALDAVARERAIHAEAHEREHHSHQREHVLNDKAIEKAEIATNLQFTNAAEALDTLRKDTDRRFNEMRNATEAQAAIFRNAINNLEKGDSKVEGKSIGQSAVIAGIAVVVGILGTLVGMAIGLSTVLRAG